MAQETVTINVTMRWWLRWIYLPCLIGFLAVARAINPFVEPDPNKIAMWVKRGLKAKVGNKEI